MYNKPNIFRLATKELSQDSFFTWLLQWADNEYMLFDPNLNEIAKAFITLLIGPQKEMIVKKVVAGRQWHNIDVWAEVNEEFFICIEDKTNTGEHSGQLERYTAKVSEQYKDKPHKLIFIYLKTGNESSTRLNKIRDKGYKVIDRKAILEVLNKRDTTNEILNDFIIYLNTIEVLTGSYTQFNKVTSDWKAAEGFYLNLEQLIPEWTDWDYVSTPKGGFLGFWYHWKDFDDFYLYIQIENVIDYDTIKLVIKISEWDQNKEALYKILDELKPYTEKYGLIISKPDRFKVGGTSTLAVIENAFIIDELGSVEIDKFILTLKNVENSLDDYCKSKSSPISA